MLEQIFKNTLLKCGINPKTNTFLVAVSGGKDSMALLDLMHREKCHLHAAHVNFNLRGIDSDGDEAFVRDYCNQRDIKLHIKSVDTKTFAIRQKISTQMAARELRYGWFKEILNTRKLDYLVTAHHLNDNIETLILGLAKGMGPSGLAGIPLLKNQLVRPLLEASNMDIIAYLEKYKITWREDVSNQSDRYLRNRIRHFITPQLQVINPGYEKTMRQNIQRFQQLEVIFRNQLTQFAAAVHKEKDTVVIPQKLIENTPGIALILEEFLKPYDFTFQQVQDLISFKESGKRVISAEFECVYFDRNFIIRPLITEYKIGVDLPTIGVYEINSRKIIINCTDVNSSKLDFSIPNTIFLDADKVLWPLHIRNWREGDRFHPYGMKGRKLVADFLKEQKIDSSLRKTQLILTDSEKILWVVGYRITETCKISNLTRKILAIKIEENCK